MLSRRLKTFVEVASALSFTRAAERLHLAQSSVSDQIKALEDDLGVVLFTRRGRSLSLTEAGLRLLTHARELLDAGARARADVASVAGRRRERLTIGGVETLCSTWLPAALAAFRTARPEAEVALTVANSGALLAALSAGELHLAALYGAPSLPEGLAAERFASDELVFVLPPDHPKAALASIPLEAMASEAFLVTEVGCVFRGAFDDLLAPVGPPRIAGVFGSLSTIGGVVAHGGGCALMPRRAVGANPVAVRPISPGPRAIDLSLAFRNTATGAGLMQRFAAYAAGAAATFTPAGDRPPRAARFPS